MSNLHEGSRVSYVGNGATGRTLGERGHILAISGRSCHTKWQDGSLTLEHLDDVAPLAGQARQRQAARQTDDLDDSLDVGPIEATGVRSMLASQGEAGVLNMLTSTGQLTGFPTIADDTRRFVEARVREEPALRAAVSGLDDDEADGVYSLAAHVLLRDAFGGNHG